MKGEERELYNTAPHPLCFPVLSISGAECGEVLKIAEKVLVSKLTVKAKACLW